MLLHIGFRICGCIDVCIDALLCMIIHKRIDLFLYLIVYCMIVRINYIYGENICQNGHNVPFINAIRFIKKT